MNDYSRFYFDGKQADEKVLYFSWTSQIQLFLELLKIFLPTLVLIIGFIIGTLIIPVIPYYIGITGIIVSGVFWLFSVIYKRYRYNQNYLVITSKRVLFHGTNGWYGDYIMKLSLDRIVDANFYTETVFGRFFGYGSLILRSETGGKDWEIRVYHIVHGKMLAHYIDKLCSLSSEERDAFSAFNPDYFKGWKQGKKVS